MTAQQNALRMLKEGDREGLRIFIHLYNNGLFRFSCNLLGDPLDALDAVNKAYRRLWLNRHLIQRPDQARRLLYLVVRLRYIG